MLIETRLRILISSESRWKLLILRKKWMWAKCFSWTWKILLRISSIMSIWIPLCPHTYVFSLPFSQISRPSSHWLPHPIPAPNSLTYRNTPEWFPQWAGLSIMLNCLGWSCGLTSSKAIWFWDKLRSREHSPDLQDLWLNKAVSLMRKEEIKRVLAFFCFFLFWQKSSWTRECPKAKPLTLRYINKTAYWFRLCRQHSRLKLLLSFQEISAPRAPNFTPRHTSSLQGSHRMKCSPCISFSVVY